MNAPEEICIDDFGRVLVRWGRTYLALASDGTVTEVFTPRGTPVLAEDDGDAPGYSLGYGDGVAHAIEVAEQVKPITRKAFVTALNGLVEVA